MFGLGGLNPKKMQAMMSQMGIKHQTIDAEQVVIKCRGKDILINNPSVSKINFSGEDMFQVSGNVEEKQDEEEISEDDINTVSIQAKVSKEKAKESLLRTKGDIAAAIMALRE